MTNNSIDNSKPSMQGRLKKM